MQDSDGTSIRASSTRTTTTTSASAISGPAFTMGARTASSAASFLATATSASMPGPGQYDVPGMALASGPAFTLRGRTRERPQERLPGPGDYGPGASRCEPAGGVNTDRGVDGGSRAR